MLPLLSRSAAQCRRPSSPGASHALRLSRHAAAPYFRVPAAPVRETTSLHSDTADASSSASLWARLRGADPVFVVAGPCAAESADRCLQIALALRRECDDLGIPFVFKASFDKANRKSLHSPRGPGIAHGLEILRSVKAEGIPVVTDVHEPWQAEQAAQVADVLQIPAFLCRQTDLIVAAAATGRIINIKRGPFADIGTMRHAVEKVLCTGNAQVVVTERGVSCGPGQLVSDPRSLVALRGTGALVVQDATHAVQASGARERVTGGRWQDAWTVARAAAAAGVHGLFFETHPDPRTAVSDAAVMIPLDRAGDLLREVVAIARVSRGFEAP